MDKVTEEEEVTLVKVDVDQNPELAIKYDVKGIPTVKAFSKGEVVDTFVGLRTPKEVKSFLSTANWKARENQGA